MTYEFVGTPSRGSTLELVCVIGLLASGIFREQHQGISVSAIVGFDTVDRLPARG
jgi:hypothetical protein